MNQIIRMIVRMFLNRGINAGINHALGPKPGQGPLTPEQKAQAGTARQNARRAKQAVRLARRLGRF